MIRPAAIVAVDAAHAVKANGGGGGGVRGGGGGGGGVTAVLEDEVPPNMNIYMEAPPVDDDVLPQSRLFFYKLSPGIWLVTNADHQPPDADEGVSITGAPWSVQAAFNMFWTWLHSRGRTVVTADVDGEMVETLCEMDVDHTPVSGPDSAVLAAIDHT